MSVDELVLTVGKNSLIVVHSDARAMRVCACRGDLFAGRRQWHVCGVRLVGSLSARQCTTPSSMGAMKCHQFMCLSAISTLPSQNSVLQSDGKSIREALNRSSVN